MEFQPWPSISRLNKDAIYTEKIDGTNAAVVIEQYQPVWYAEGSDIPIRNVEIDGTVYSVWAQSRKRFIYPGDDNFAFAHWVDKNAENLVRLLGVGRHFGEWWGSGIQGGYGLPKDERRFSLFNVKRWEHTLTHEHGHEMIPELYLVPVLGKSTFSTVTAKLLVEYLREHGSEASPGFKKPEGVVVFHTASGTPYKTFLENDDIHKSQLKGN